MERILLLALCLLLISCEKTNRRTEKESTREAETISDESVEIGSGTEISPQLKGVEDSAVRMKVDTINSAQETRERK